MNVFQVCAELGSFLNLAKPGTLHSTVYKGACVCVCLCLCVCVCQHVCKWVTFVKCATNGY